MRLRHIEVFHAVMQAGTISGAAQLLHISQPAATKALQHCELRLGLPLFDRVRGKLYAAPEAQRLFLEVEKVHRDLLSIRRLAANLRSNEAEQLKLVSSPTLGASVVPDAIAQWSQAYPNARCLLATNHTREIVNALLLGEAHLALSLQDPHHPGIKVEVLARGPLVALCPINSPEGMERGELAVANITSEVISLEEGDPLGSLVNDAFEAGGVRPQSRITVQTYQVALSQLAEADLPLPQDLTGLADAHQAALQAGDNAWAQGLVALTGLLHARVDGLYTRMALHLGTALLLLAAILSVVYLVAAQIARPLSGLADVAEQVRLTADYTQRAHWHSTDEIGRLFTAFNSMLAQLDQDRLVQQELAANARAAQAQHEVVEAFPIPMVVTSVPDHRILHVNVPARPWVGECKLDPWRTGLEPGVRARFFQRLSDRDAVDEFEVRWLGGAEPTWAVLSARRLVYQGQDAVLTAFTPINVLKVMEQRLELWAKVFEASSEGIIIMNAQRKVVSVNAAFCRSTGYEYYEVLGEEMGFMLEGQGPDWAALTDMDAWQGEVRFRRQSGDTYPAWLMVSAVREGNTTTPAHLIGIAIDITDRKAKEERIRFLAQHDVLTELPNRALCQLRLTEALAAARACNEQVAVLFIDLDRFKLVNDTMGHHIGDGLLRTVARRLVQAVRSHDTVSRLGGDEFVIVMRHVTGRDELDALVNKRLIPAVRQSLVVEGHTLSVSCSVGMALYPQDGTDEDELMRRADAAMYEAKSAGRDTARYFSAETDQRVLARQGMEAQLRTALAHNEFSVHFQPRLSARSRKLRGAEALLRWQHDGSYIPPDQFIPVAEQSGLIIGLGDWVLQTACLTMRRLLALGLAPRRMAVNVSVVQFQSPGFVERVYAALASADLTGEQLELEITESVAMLGAGVVEPILQTLRERGISVAIDDFGTGYSSLAYLERLPLDRIKIDKAFVFQLSKPGGPRIAEMITQLGHKLGLRVLAEGVEDQDAWRALQELGCHEAQGYFIARPMESSQLTAWLMQRASTPDDPSGA